MLNNGYKYTRILGEGVIGVYVPAMDIDWIICLSDKYDRQFWCSYMNDVREVIERNFETDSDEDVFEEIRAIDQQNIEVALYVRETIKD